MPNLAPNPQLLRSLGKLARGLSALFWGLPINLLVSADIARTDWLQPLGMLPLVAVNSLTLYGLWQMGAFQKQERPWRLALDRARLLALINLGLCPFLYWYNRLPQVAFFNYSVALLAISAVLLLFNLNVMLKRLAAMLPDETLRQETRQFTSLNLWLLVLLVVIATGVVTLARVPHLALPAEQAMYFVSRFGHMLFLLLLVFFILLPLAITMALIWKTKEVILDAVFGSRH
jgi:hypothetical protein